MSHIPHQGPENLITGVTENDLFHLCLHPSSWATPETWPPKAGNLHISVLNGENLSCFPLQGQECLQVSSEGAGWQPGPEISGHLFLHVVIQETFKVSSIKSWNSSLDLIGSRKEAALFLCKCFNGAQSKMHPTFYFSFALATATAMGTFSLSKIIHREEGKCLLYESVWKTQNFHSVLSLIQWAYNMQGKLTEARTLTE